MAAMPNRRLISWFFALALLFGQAAAFAHALTHLSGHDSGLPDKVCEMCVAHAQLGSAAPASPPLLALPAGEAAEHAARVAWRADTPCRTACARAPPAPSRS